MLCCLLVQLFGAKQRFKKEDFVVLQALHSMDRLTEATGRVMPVWMDNRSLFVFGPRNRFRLGVKKATAHKLYQVCVHHV